jgi:hypothetical protein
MRVRTTPAPPVHRDLPVSGQLGPVPGQPRIAGILLIDPGQPSRYARPVDATFFFDPACPFSWRASRWLVTVAQARGLTVEWRAFSLAILNEGDDDRKPEPYRQMMAAAKLALRLVEALRAAGRAEDVARFYTELGSRTHEVSVRLSEPLVREAVVTAGLTDAAGALDDGSWDAAVRESHMTAYESAGPDIGSPVFTVPGASRGLHGPILSQVPTKEDALTIWDSVVPLLRMPAFFEVKRGRR